MTELILPDSEPVTAKLIKPSRRGFVAILTGAIVAPMIVRADSLMQIHTIENRMIVAFGGYREGLLRPSLMNWGDYSPLTMAMWQERFHNNYYLVRMAEIQEQHRNDYGGLVSFRHLAGLTEAERRREYAIRRDRMMLQAQEQWAERHGNSGLLI